MVLQNPLLSQLSAPAVLMRGRFGWIEGHGKKTGYPIIRSEGLVVVCENARRLLNGRDGEREGAQDPYYCNCRFLSLLHQKKHRCVASDRTQNTWLIGTESQKLTEVQL